MLRVQTRVCQNDCGGHGNCDQATRKCICQVLTYFHFHMGIVDSKNFHVCWALAVVDVTFCSLPGWKTLPPPGSGEEKAIAAGV